MLSKATTQPPAIDATGLSKRFDDTTAVDGLDLTVAAGSFFGLLGPNGAGKTTTVGLLTTLVAPSEGSARVLGRDVVTEAAAVRRDVGLVFQESTLDPELTAREHLDLFARLYHLADRTPRVKEMLSLVGLADVADRPTRGFSGGMKRRLEIARGLLHEPRLLFLDEPTLGLDVAARAQVWDHLKTLRQRGGVTIFMTTHSMEEADALCERVAILDRGRVVVEGTPEALKASLGGDAVCLDLERAGDAAACLSRQEGVRGVVRENDGEPARFRVTVSDGPRRLAALVDAARPFGIREVTLHRPSLEHVFLHHTGHAFEVERR